MIDSPLALMPKELVALPLLARATQLETREPKLTEIPFEPRFPCATQLLKAAAVLVTIPLFALVEAVHWCSVHICPTLIPMEPFVCAVQLDKAEPSPPLIPMPVLLAAEQFSIAAPSP